MWRPTQMPAAAATSWAAVKQATSQVRDQPSVSRIVVLSTGKA